MSDVIFITAIEPPQLTDVMRASLIRFEVDYAAYVEKIADVNRSREPTRQIVAANIRHCIEPRLLKSLCIIGCIENAASIEDVTDNAVRKWLESILDGTSMDMAERYRFAMGSVSYKLDKKDPARGVISFIEETGAALKSNRLSEMLQDEATCNTIFEALLSKLYPPELRERVRDSRDFWTRDQKASLPFFQEKVSSLAVSVYQGGVARAKLRRIKKKRNRKHYLSKPANTNVRDSKTRKK